MEEDTATVEEDLVVDTEEDSVEVTVMEEEDSVADTAEDIVMVVEEEDSVADTEGVTAMVEAVVVLAVATAMVVEEVSVAAIATVEEEVMEADIPMVEEEVMAVAIATVVTGYSVALPLLFPHRCSSPVLGLFSVLDLFSVARWEVEKWDEDDDFASTTRQLRSSA